MKVMSFNILCGGRPKSRFWTKRKRMVRDTIKKYSPDTFGLQEAHYRWMRYLYRGLKNTYDYVGVGRDDGKRKGEFSPVFYKKDKYEVVEKGNFWLSETPEKPGKGWDAACIRICSYAVLRDKATGEKIAHFNTHLDHIGDVARSEGAKLIAERADVFKGVPTIVTGDFNVNPESGAYKTIIAQGFTDARTLDENANDVKTYNGFDENTPEMIDFVFIKNGFKVKLCNTITDKVGDRFISDHYPVLAELEL